MAELDYAPGKALRVAVGTYANIFWRMNFLPKAHNNQRSHQHPIPHVTMLVKGRVRAEIENFPPYEYTAPAFIEVPANKPHRYIALEDGTLYFCIFNTCPEGYVADGTTPIELNQLTQLLCGSCQSCDG